MDTTPPAPPFDPELGAALAAVSQGPVTITAQMIAPMREALRPTVAEVMAGREVEHEEHRVPVAGGEVTLSLFWRAGAATSTATAKAGIFYAHGGGMIVGNQHVGAQEFLTWVEELDVVVASVDYRLAPDFPDPVPADDCWAALVWLAGRAEGLGIDPDRLVVAGASSGGGLAAGLTLRARDAAGPALAGSLLIYPMIDDRNDTLSSRQIDGIGSWDRGSNDTGWDALLGDRRRTDAVSPYAAPARAGPVRPAAHLRGLRQRGGLPRRGRRLRLPDLGAGRDRRAARVARGLPWLRCPGPHRPALPGRAGRPIRLAATHPAPLT